MGKLERGHPRLGKRVEPLTPRSLSVVPIVSGMFLDFQEAYHFSEARRQDDYWWPFIRNNVRFYLSRPGGRYWWRSQGKNMLDPQFVEFVDKDLL